MSAPDVAAANLPGSSPNGQIATYDLSAESILNVVGLTVSDLVSGTRSDLDAGPAYLVGSLAGGLGNAGSDIDVNIFQPDLTARVGPYMHFIGDVVIDLENYPQQWPVQVAAQARELPTVLTPVGQICLDPAPQEPVDLATVGRWLHAVPFADGTPPIFGPQDAAALLAVLTRDALDDVLRAVALARLADAGGPRSAAQFLWRRATRRYLDLRCRAAGDVTLNDKWLPARVRRLGLSGLTEAQDEEEFLRLTASSCLPLASAWELTTVRLAAEARRIKFGGTKWLLSRHGRLLPDWTVSDGTLAEQVAACGAERLLEGLRRAELDLSVDTANTRKALAR